MVASSKAQWLIQGDEHCCFLALLAQQQKCISCFSLLEGLLKEDPFCFLLPCWTDKYNFKHASVVHQAVTQQSQLFPSLFNFVIKHKCQVDQKCIYIWSLANDRWLRRVQTPAISGRFSPWYVLPASHDQLFMTFFRRRLDTFFWWLVSFPAGRGFLFCFGEAYCRAKSKAMNTQLVPWMKGQATAYKTSHCTCHNNLFWFYSTQYRSVRSLSTDLNRSWSQISWGLLAWAFLFCNATTVIFIKTQQKELLLLLCETKYSCISLMCWHGAINLQDSRTEWWSMKLKFQLKRRSILISEYPTMIETFIYNKTAYLQER